MRETVEGGREKGRNGERVRRRTEGGRKEGRAVERKREE